MLVKAKWSVRDASGWHDAGEVFRTESDLGDAVEVLDAPKKAEPVKQVEAPEPEPAKEPEKEAEVAEAPVKARTTRRKTAK